VSAAVSRAKARSTRSGTCSDQVMDPEIPVISVVDLGIVREVRESGEGLEVVITPTYRGVRRRARSSRISAPRWRAPVSRPGSASCCRRRGPPTGSARRAGRSSRLRHRAAGGQGRQAGDVRRRAAGGVPAVRVAADRNDFRVRLDAMQGAVALHAVPRAVRLLQVHLMDAPSQLPPHPSPPPRGGRERARRAREFHALTVADVRRETDEAVSVAFEVPEELKDHFRFVQGQYLTLACHGERRGAAAALFGVRGARGRRAAGLRQEASWRAVLELRQ
jgi:hypothetical protein